MLANVRQSVLAEDVYRRHDEELNCDLLTLPGMKKAAELYELHWLAENDHEHAKRRQKMREEMGNDMYHYRRRCKRHFRVAMHKRASAGRAKRHI